MAIAFNCTGCGKHYEVSDNLAGKRGKCKQCGQMMMIPSAAPAQNDIYGLEEEPAPALAPLAPMPRRAGAGAVAESSEGPVKKKKKKGGFFGGSKSKAKGDKSSRNQAAGLGAGGVAFIVMMIFVRVGLRQGVNHLFSGVNSKSAFETYVKTEVDSMNELASIFRTVRDEPSANAAVDKSIPIIESSITRYGELKVKKFYEKDMNAVVAEYQGPMQAASTAWQREALRVGMMPEAHSAMLRLTPYLERLTAALPPEQQAQARLLSQGPNMRGGGAPPPQFTPPPTMDPQQQAQMSPPSSSSPPPQFSPPPPNNNTNNNSPAASGFPQSPPGGNPAPNPNPGPRFGPRRRPGRP